MVALEGRVGGGWDCVLLENKKSKPSQSGERENIVSSMISQNSRQTGEQVVSSMTVIKTHRRQVNNKSSHPASKSKLITHRWTFSPMHLHYRQQLHQLNFNASDYSCAKIFFSCFNTSLSLNDNIVFTLHCRACLPTRLKTTCFQLKREQRHHEEVTVWKGTKFLTHQLWNTTAGSDI